MPNSGRVARDTHRRGSEDTSIAVVVHCYKERFWFFSKQTWSCFWIKSTKTLVIHFEGCIDRLPLKIALYKIFVNGFNWLKSKWQTSACKFWIVLSCTWRTGHELMIKCWLLNATSGSGSSWKLVFSLRQHRCPQPAPQSLCSHRFVLSSSPVCYLLLDDF